MSWTDKNDIVFGIAIKTNGNDVFDSSNVIKTDGTDVAYGRSSAISRTNKNGIAFSCCCIIRTFV